MFNWINWNSRVENERFRILVKYTRILVELTKNLIDLTRILDRSFSIRIPIIQPNMFLRAQ